MSVDAVSLAVSAALNSALGSAADLLTAVDELSPVWAAELAEVREQARSQQAVILSERASLRKALNHGARLLDALSPNSNSTRATLSLASSEAAASAVALKNISDTIHLVSFLEAAPKLIADATDMLDRVSEASPGSAGIASNIFHAHENIVACERIRDIALLDALPNLDDAGRITDIFDGAESARDQLEYYLMANMFADVARYARADPRALVAAVRIVQREGQEDDWWEQYLCRTGLSSAGSLVRPYVRREYERRVHEATIQSIERGFSQPPSAATSLDDTFAWIKKLVAEEQETRRFVVPCFPPSYDIGTVFTKQYHKSIMTVLTEMFGSSSLEERDEAGLLRMVQWYGEYRRGNGIESKTSGLELSDVQRDRLIAAVERHGRSKVESRVKEILSEDSTSIIQQDRNRSVAIGTLANANTLDSESVPSWGNEGDSGMCTTAAPELVFSAVGKQIKDARVLGVPAVNTAVANLVTWALRTFQCDVRNVLDICAKKADPLSSSNPKYVCAIANNMARCLSYVEELRESVASDVDESSRVGIEEDFEDVMDGFRWSSSVAVDDLCSGVEKELAALTHRFFAPRTGTEVMLDVIEILNEFFTRYEMWLMPYHFEHFAVGCLKRVVLQYIRPFLSLRDAVSGSLSQPVSGIEGHERNSISGRVVPGDRDFDDVADEMNVISSSSRQGLASMKADAVIAQLDMDLGNLRAFFETKVMIYERKQLEPAIETISSVRDLFTCSPTSQSLVAAYMRAAGVIFRLGAGETLEVASARFIWTMRSDVKPSALLEAYSTLRLHSGGTMRYTDFAETFGVKSDVETTSSKYELMWGARLTA
jgi:hypothetical protein